MALYHPFSPEIMGGNPYPIYARLREEAPAFHIEEFDAWALSRFEDVWNASMDAEHFSAAQGTTSAHLLTKVQPVTPMLNMMDPPEHTELRAQMRHSFTPARVRGLEPQIREQARTLLDAARDRGEIDVVQEFSSPIAVRTACTIIGIPREDEDHLVKLVIRFFARDPEIEGMTPDGVAAMEEMFGYFVGLSERRRKMGGEPDIVKMLTEVEVAGEKLPAEAIASHLTMLIIGGSETFPKVLANNMRWLAEHPDQRAMVAADRALIPDAFLEVLRYDMPTQFLCRVVKKDLEMHGEKLRAGQPVLFLYPSANRDPREFPDPDRLDVKRRAPRILSFGHGTHLCLGIHVAKLEGRVLLEEVLERFPEWECDMARANRLVTDFVQGYASLPVRFRPW